MLEDIFVQGDIITVRAFDLKPQLPYVLYTLMITWIFLCGGSAGRDDAKVLIPATVVLRYMFTPAEMRVSFEPSIGCRSPFPRDLFIYIKGSQIIINYSKACLDAKNVWKYFRIVRIFLRLGFGKWEMLN